MHVQAQMFMQQRRIEKDKVSLITPAYNSSRYIDKTIRSVVAQTYQNWEMLIVDDGSNDETVSIVEAWNAKDSRVKLFRNGKNLGQGKSRNRAIKEANGRYIAFLDSDDLWHPHKLEVQIFAMLEFGSAFSHTSFGYINDEGEEIKKSLITSDESVTYDYLLKHTEISCLTTIYDAKVLGKMYMPDIRRSQDYVLWLSILKRTNSLPIKEVLAFYRLHENNISKNKFKKITLHWKVLRKYENLPLLKSCYYFSFWAIGGLYKYYIK
jgi:teichuronic acid biosynthesis glycosyltransferase TuaG